MYVFVAVGSAKHGENMAGGPDRCNYRSQPAQADPLSPGRLLMRSNDSDREVVCRTSPIAHAPELDDRHVPDLRARRGGAGQGPVHYDELPRDIGTSSASNAAAVRLFCPHSGG